MQYFTEYFAHEETLRKMGVLCTIVELQSSLNLIRCVAVYFISEDTLKLTGV